MDAAEQFDAVLVALGIAAILEDRDRFAGRHVATVVCGGNVDADAYRSWLGANHS